MNNRIKRKICAVGLAAFLLVSVSAAGNAVCKDADVSVSAAEADESFEPNVMILDILDKMKGGKNVSHISIMKHGKGKVIFENIEDMTGRLKAVRCSEVKIIVQ